MYGGLGLLFFFLILFLQQVAGYSALEAGTATLPVSIVMFFLSARFGALADRYGPRWFMGGGPLVCAVGLALFARLDEDVSYLTDLLPAMLLFALGLSMTVAPLTATVLADADEHNAGVASGVNNAIARVAGLVAVASVGVLISAQYGSALEEQLGPLADRPALAAPLEAAKRQPLAEIDAPGLPPAAARAAGGGDRRRLGQRLPPGDGCRRRAGGGRRTARPDRAAQPPARGQVRGLPRRRARGRAVGCGSPG